MRRFERIHDVVEPVEEYRRGGYHPVQLHDIFHGRYKVLGKLAYGQYSTVWLAEDTWGAQVALKILKADASSNELSLSFITYPVVQTIQAKHTSSPFSTTSTTQGQTEHTSVLSSRQCYVTILRGVDFLHRLGVVHCDLQPANIMLSIPGHTPSDSLQDPEFSPVRWLSGVVEDNSAPVYLMPSQRRRGFLDRADSSTLQVRIGDLGCGKTLVLYPVSTDSLEPAQWGQRDKPVTPVSLRAPELIRQDQWDMGIDIWALGCLISELATNEPLFPVGTFGLTREEINNKHEVLISQLFGQGGQGLARYLTDRLPGFRAENVQSLAGFLSCMLKVNPKRRMETGELLYDPFVN